MTLILALLASIQPVPLADCTGRHNPADCRVAQEIERKNGPAGDERCTEEYQRRTGWKFYADDRPDCPDLRRPREQRR